MGWNKYNQYYPNSIIFLSSSVLMRPSTLGWFQSPKISPLYFLPRTCYFLLGINTLIIFVFLIELFYTEISLSFLEMENIIIFVGSLSKECIETSAYSSSLYKIQILMVKNELIITILYFILFELNQYDKGSWALVLKVALAPSLFLIWELVILRILLSFLVKPISQGNQITYVVRKPLYKRTSSNKYTVEFLFNSPLFLLVIFKLTSLYWKKMFAFLVAQW